VALLRKSGDLPRRSLWERIKDVALADVTVLARGGVKAGSVDDIEEILLEADFGVPVTLREYLTLMQAMQADLASRRVEDFYYLSRATLVKDERNLDKFDRVFGHVFKGLDLISDAVEAEIPAEWLKKLAEKYLTEEEKKQIEAMGGLDKLMETLRKRLAEQKGRHQGGSKWIGTGGTSPFGNAGYNPEGIRIGGESTHRRAVKVSPGHYHHVRLHKGSIPGKLHDGGDIRVERTKYFDFDTGNGTWFGLREFE